MRMKKLPSLISFVLMSSIATSAFSEELSVENNSANSYLTLGKMEVNASSTGTLRSQDMLTSVDILGSSLIENQNVDNSWELFSQLPGVAVTNFNQGAISGEFAIRGFNAEGEINAVKLLIDGIPSNTNSGNMEYIDTVSTLDIDSIELVRGTNDPRYGLHNIAGNANILTRLGGNYTQARTSVGSYDTYDLQVTKGIESNTFSQNYSMNYHESGGYRDHADADKLSFSGKWFVTPDNANYTAGIIARWHQSEADSPGYLTLNETRADPKQAFSDGATDGTEYDIGQFSAHLDVDISDKLFWSVKSYINTFDKSRWVKFAPGSGQQERVEDEFHYGAISTLTYRQSDALTLEGGIDYEHQQNESLRYADIDRIRQSQTRNQDFEQDTFGAFVQASVSPTTWLKLVPALRVDTIKGDFTDKLNSTTKQINDYDAIWQPKFSAVITPIEGYSLYGNWGRTFQVGVGAGAYYSDGDPMLEPSINDGWEIGLKFKPVESFEGRVAYWEQTASNEVRRILLSANGDSENVGETKRRGIDVQASLQLTDPLSVWASYSWQEAIIENPGTNDLDTLGKELNHTPDFLISAGASYQITPKFSSSLTAYAQGDYYVEKTNSLTGQFGDYYWLNVAFDYQVTKMVSLDLQLKNITDQDSEYVWHWSGSDTRHSEGDGRTVYGAITLSY
jgi:iron complex outermembrane receptor protein